MKKKVVIALMAMMAVAQVNAQSATDIRKQAAKEQKAAVKTLDREKAAKDAKKTAKQMQKDGWQTMASDKPLEMQITDDRVKGAELMTDNGNTYARWIMHTSMATQGSYNAAVAQARLACQTEIATQIETKLAGALEQKLSGTQEEADKATTLDKFHQRFQAIVDGCLTNVQRGLCVYRRTDNSNYEVQVTYAYDKKELAARLLKQAKRELELEGDGALGGAINDVMQNWE